jgi:hypothetical protein
MTPDEMRAYRQRCVEKRRADEAEANQRRIVARDLLRRAGELIEAAGKTLRRARP